MDKDKIFFTSDTHAFHKNMTYGESSWDDKDVFCRKFNTAVEMTIAMADAINGVVPEDGTLIHLGDWSFNGIDKINKFRDMIKCKNIIIIPGNHDEVISKGRFHELFKAVVEHLDITIDGNHIHCSHMPIIDTKRLMMDDANDVILLHGHLHGRRLSKEFKGIRIDVGVDTNNLKPYSWEEIIQIAAKKKESLKKIS